MGKELNKNNDNDFRKLMLWAIGVLIIALITFIITFTVYNNKVKNESRVSQLNSKKIGELVPSLQTNESTEEASTFIGKSINEAKETGENIEQENNIPRYEEEDNTKQDNNIQDKNTASEQERSSSENKENEAQKKELNFKMPVDGEIVTEFAKDNLIYSETLKEWITHLGIDIKAEKTTVVKASEEGTVKSIKSDPRYGLAVTVEHENGMKTVYANLLTAEFVTEGEKVTQGQTLGTVGATANFEVLDETHLHFEMWKDGEAVNPIIYLK